MHSELLGRVPPQATEFEEAVLGAIMLERDAFDEVAEMLSADMFYLEIHKRIYAACASLASSNQPIDLLTVVARLRATEQLELAGGPFAVTKITNTVVSSANIKAHADNIRAAYRRRELIRSCGDLINMAYTDLEIDSDDLLDLAESAISDIDGKSRSEDMVPIEEVVTEALMQVQEFMDMPGTVTGVPSGFDKIDQLTRGWQPADFVILAARPSVGKTALALNLVKAAASNPTKPVTVAVWSLEMAPALLALRMMSAESGIRLDGLQTGTLQPDEMDKLINSSNKKISPLRIFFDKNSTVNLKSIQRKARRLKKKQDLGIIFIDYLQLIEGEGKGNRESDISRISRGLKNLAKELHIPIIALSQLSRETGEKNINWEYGPPIASLRESGSLEQDADTVVMVWGPSKEDLQKDNTLYTTRRANVAKNRNGSLGIVDLEFKKDIQKFLPKEEFGLPPQFRPITEDEKGPF